MRRVLFVSQKYICAFLMLLDGVREIPFPGKEQTCSAPLFHNAQSVDGCQRRLSLVCFLSDMQRTTMGEEVREQGAHVPWPSREREGGREGGKEGGRVSSSSGHSCSIPKLRRAPHGRGRGFCGYVRARSAGTSHVITKEGQL
jgi:hypothetical protein